jgi:hypothetical protein
MLATTHTTAIAAFDSRAPAERAIAELICAGFTWSQLGFITRSNEEVLTDANDTETRAEGGAAAGAVTGGVLGAVVGGVAALALPGIGPILAAGLLAGVLGGGAVGAWGGGLIGALVGLALPQEEAQYYEEELRAGRTLVLVQAGERYPEAMDILSRCGGSYVEPFTDHNNTTAQS